MTRLPRSYDTLLSRIFFEGVAGRRTVGVTLSGGQWQRLAIARAYARGERDLVILDEPSSGLDAEAEAEVHRGLTEHRTGRTSLLISHRLGSVRTADDLVVLDGGQVVEQGTRRQHESDVPARRSAPATSYRRSSWRCWGTTWTAASTHVTTASSRSAT